VYWAGVLHLVTHALFKGCLFLGAGSVMHGMGDRTDIREMGGLAKKMPQTAWTFGIATVAATGILPLSGFFSKDGILAGAHATVNPAAAWVGPTVYWIGTIAALGTAFYMTRLFVLTFLGKPRSGHAEHAHESSPVMYLPLWALAIGAVVAAVLGLPALHFIPERLQDVFGHFTDPVFEPAYERLRHVGHLPAEAHEGIGPFAFAWLVAAVGTGIAWFMYKDPATVPARLADAFPRLYRFALDKFRVDELYEAVVLNPVKATARGLWKIVDVGIIDGLCVNGIPRAVAFSGSVVRLAQNGDVQRYAALMAVAAALILFAVLGGATP
jgi:NADH-quinone oxidoreductase subunit L